LKNTSSPGLKRQVVLLALPLCLLAGSILLVAQRGPYFLGMNLDPEYAYLLNALNILTLNAPYDVHHPGTTLQVLSAGLILLMWMGRGVVLGVESIQHSVAGHPEQYLRFINLALNCLFCGSVFVVSRSLLRRSASLIPPLVFQLSLLVYLELFIAQTRVSPEPLLLVAVMLFLWALAPALLPLEDEPVRSRHAPLLAGVALGFGVVTKVVFLPLVLLCVVLPGWRSRGSFLAAAGVASVAFLLPAISRFDGMLHWMWALVSRRGPYGPPRAIWGRAGRDTAFRALSRRAGSARKG
jgi:hypothetical protein